MSRDPAAEATLRRRIRLALTLGGLLQLLIGLLSFLLIPAALTCLLTSLRATRGIDRTDAQTELWAGAALLASLVPAGAGALAGVWQLFGVAALSTLLLTAGWWWARQHAAVRRRRWQLERRLHAPPVETILRRPPSTATPEPTERHTDPDPT